MTNVIASYRVMVRRGDEAIPFSRRVHGTLAAAVRELQRAESLPSGNLSSVWIERDGEPFDHLAAA